MSYYFFLGDTMLPVPPPKMNVTVKNKNKTINLINEGEINIIKAPGLSEISFDARLPNAKYPFADYDTSLADSVSNFFGNSYSFKKADYFMDTFRQSKQSNLPFRLIISRMSADSMRLLFDTNMLVTLEDYSMLEDAGEGFDVIVPLKLKQYRPYATKELEKTTDENGDEKYVVKETRQTDKPIPAVYKIRNEKSMWEISKRLTNGSLDWRTLMNSNSITNPVGQEKGVILNLG